MRTHKIPPYYRKIKDILIMPPYLALLSTLIISNYPYLELVFMVPTVFEPLKFDCIMLSGNKQTTLNISNTDISKHSIISKNIVWTHFLFLFAFQLLGPVVQN